ncbi:MAG: CFI-box-CTERM domain-containing protein [Pseudobdellovibrionaceae bacterium]
MKYWALSILAGFLFSSMQSHATMTVTSISGDSARDLSTPTAPIIYAGFTTGCTATDGVNTCDSCQGTSRSGSLLWPCNKHSAYPGLMLTVVVQSTLTGVTAANAYVKIAGNAVTPVNAFTVANGQLTVNLTWSEICSAHGVDQSAQCTAGFATDLEVGFSGGSTGTTSSSDSITFKIRTRVAASDNSDWLYTDCRKDTSTPNTGACYFTAYPGDGKIYANDFSVSEGYPGTSIPGVEFTNTVFFYEAEATPGESDSAIISRLSNKSNIAILNVNKAANPPLADNRINGLTNGVKYCMVMANEDATGIISYFTPLPGVGSSPVQANELCTTPSAVVGLLDDKHCFIATAAFGSDMAPEVQSFRDFRNKYLLPHSWGRAFVKFYYKHSPFYANQIAKSEFTKSIARGALWPLLLFARMCVSLGFWTSLLITSLVCILVFLLYRYWALKRNFQGVPRVSGVEL